MKIAMPVSNGKLCMHFGHCEQFALVEIDDSGDVKTMRTTMATPPPHEPGLLPRWLHEQGVDVVIAGGMGQRAQQLFAQRGIRVLLGAPPDSPETIVAAYLDNHLALGENPCDH